MKNVYSENIVKTASPAKLIEMLYEKSIELLNDAKQELEKEDFIATNERIKRVQDIVTELNLSLDMEKGGNIAASLRALYNYIYRLLIEGNTKRNPEKIDEASFYFKELLEAWRSAMKAVGNTANMKSDQGESHFNVSI